MSTDHPLPAAPDVRINHPEWSRRTRRSIRSTPASSPRRARSVPPRTTCPRLQELGAVILWLMPVQLIGEKNRKGTLGSPYAVKDYYAVEPDLGTLDDLRHFVGAAHDAGHVRDSGLGRQPHRVGQQPGHRTSRVVRPGLEGRLPADAVVGLGRHHRPGLRPSPNCAGT